MQTSTLKRHIYRSRHLYLLLLPAVAYYALFKYVPIYGLQLAFKKFSYSAGISASPWVGLDNFRFLWGQTSFWAALRNTLTISLLRLVFGFPVPILLALLINELRMPKFKRGMQIICTFPHFLSWVILSGIILNLMGSTGGINALIARMGGQKINFLLDGTQFRALLIYSEVWKEAGWGTIVYIATITAVDTSQYEAAIIDGANRWQKIRYVIWPVMLPVAITMMILSVGNALNAGFMQIFNLYNPTVFSTSDILDTYIYRMSFQTNIGFGVSTAVGMFKGFTNCILLLTANAIARMVGQKGIT